MGNEKDTTLTAITSGSKYFSNIRSPATSHTQTLSNPFRNLTNKVRGKIFYKEVFLRPSFLRPFFLRLCPCVCLIIVSLWYRRWLYNNGILYMSFIQLAESSKLGKMACFKKRVFSNLQLRLIQKFIWGVLATPSKTASNKHIMNSGAIWWRENMKWTRM